MASAAAAASEVPHASRAYCCHAEHSVGPFSPKLFIYLAHTHIQTYTCACICHILPRHVMTFLVWTMNIFDKHDNKTPVIPIDVTNQTKCADQSKTEVKRNPKGRRPQSHLVLHTTNLSVSQDHFVYVMPSVCKQHAHFQTKTTGVVPSMCPYVKAITFPYSQM